MSEALNDVVLNVTRGTRFAEYRRKPSAQGTCSRSLPAGAIWITPVTRRASGAAGAVTVTSTRAARPIGSTSRSGTTLNPSASDSPSAIALIESCSRRVDTLRTTSVRVACHRGPSQMPKPSVDGCAATSPTADVPSRNVPAPTSTAGAPPRAA